MSTKKTALLFMIAALLLSACAPTATPVAQAPDAQAPTAQPQPSNTPKPTNTLTPTVDAAATQIALHTAEAQSTADAKATAGSAKMTQWALNKQATLTAVQSAKQTHRVELTATAAAQVESFQSLVNTLYDEGKLKSKEGEYYQLPDFEESMARINTPFIFYLDYSVVDFIISADLAWESASENANWPTSGCGFVYGYKDRYTADLTFLGLDGYTHSMQFRPDKPLGLFAFNKWGDPDRPKGQAKAMLVVSDKHVYVYVNGALANSFYNGLYDGGELGLNIFSGTNAGYGTRCNFSNLELFIFE
jgi:hypothetical protein